jgi:hypothetical protein
LPSFFFAVSQRVCRRCGKKATARRRLSGKFGTARIALILLYLKSEPRKVETIKMLNSPPRPACVGMTVFVVVGR